MLGVDMVIEIVSLALLLLAMFAILSAIRKRKEMESQQMQEAKARIANDLEILDTAIADWLVMLELPALVEQTKRLEAARRLRTVLIEKLLQKRILC